MSQKEYTSFRKNIIKINNKNEKIKETLDYDEAENLILDYISEKQKLSIQVDKDTMDLNRNLSKADLHREKAKMKNMISDCLMSKNISIRGYEQDKLEDFIQEMVGEYSGYSILEDAFNDEEISDIYCLSWNKIYVEKNGVNVDYHKKFKNKRKYKDFIERILRKAGKEINVGDNKIVDFEIYGDRGCCTSPSVTPKDYTITMRKHKEDPIKLDDLLYQQVINEEISEFFGLAIDGESNLIYAGITGTGKTTTIRALLDYYIEKNKKRAITCEDTQELFLKSEYTMETISCRTNKEESDVSLYKLILTALRLKPRYIIVGEIRGEEAQAAVEAMETGHSTFCTMHAGKPINAINRIISKYIMKMPNLTSDVVERIIGEAVDFVAIQDQNDERGRYLSIISEVTYDYEKNRVKLDTLLEYDVMTDDWVWVKRINKDKCRNFRRKGCSKERILKWMETDDPEEEKRALKELNETYYKEKENRLLKYREEHNKKIEEKNKKIIKENNLTVSDEKDETLVQEALKEKELKEMKDKINSVIE